MANVLIVDAVSTTGEEVEQKHALFFRFYLLLGTGYDSPNNADVNDSVMTQDSIFISRPPSPSLEQALTTYIPNTSNANRQQRIEGYTFIFM
jgi:hypothetical protein